MARPLRTEYPGAHNQRSTVFYKKEHRKNWRAYENATDVKRLIDESLDAVGIASPFKQ